MGKKRTHINTSNGASFDLLWSDLTRMEKKTYEKMAELGCGFTELAKIIGVSPRTTESHYQAIFAKFGFTGTPEAIAAYYKNKIEKLTAK